MSYRKGRRTTSGGASTAAGRTRCGRCAVSPPARTAHDRPLAHPFLALLIAAIATGLIAGASPADTVEYITTGFGETLGSIGIVIILGVMIGKLLEISGAADAIAASFLAVVGRGREDWAMAGTGALVSIPVSATRASSSCTRCRGR